MKYFSGHENYYQAYGLDNDPFPEDIFDNIIYITPELNHRLELIKHLLEFSQQLLLVTGPPEAGKSTLCGYLPSTFAGNWSTGIISASEYMTPEALATSIIDQVYPDNDTRTGTAITRLHEYLEYCGRRQMLPVIMIDDGHKLSLDALAFILQLNTLNYNETRFRFVIFADPGINATLDDPRIKVATTGIIHSINIPLLTEAQTSAYLEYRLRSSGNINEYPFAGEDTNHIYKVSGGAPGRINRLARQALQDPALSSAAGPGLWVRNILQQLPNPILGAVIICLAIGVYFYARLRPVDGQSQTIAIALPSQETLAHPVPVSRTATDPDFTEPGPSPSSLNTVADAPEQLEPAKPALQADVKGSIEPRQQPEPMVITPPQPIPAPASTGPESMSRLFAGLKDGNWVRSQDPGHYVLQLIGARDVKTLEQYLAGAPEIRSKLAVIATWNAGKPWYVFIYGMYPDRDTAVAAASKLPAVVRSSQPWPRTVASVLIDLQKTE